MNDYHFPSSQTESVHIGASSQDQLLPQPSPNRQPLLDRLKAFYQKYERWLWLGLSVILVICVIAFAMYQPASSQTQTNSQLTPTITSQPSPTELPMPTDIAESQTPQPTSKPRPTVVRLTLTPTPKPTVAVTSAPAPSTTPAPTVTPTPTPDTIPPVISWLHGPEDGGTYTFEGYCFPMYITDNVDKIPGQVKTRHKQDSADWSVWSAEYAPCYTNVPKGVHQFSLQIRDSSGNETAIMTRTFTLE